MFWVWPFLCIFQRWTNSAQLLLKEGSNLEGMHYSDLQLRALSQELVKEGFFFYQLSFVWGCTPGIRNRSGTQFYFLVNGSIWTPAELHDHLRRTWRPTSHAEVLYFKNRLDAHFSVYPKETPGWEGTDARQVLLNPERVVAMAG